MNIEVELIPEPVRLISSVLRDKGYRSWIVGGCVRDILRGAEDKISDWDLTTDALPEQVVEAFPKVIPTGIQHGTVTVMIDGVGYEVTTLRGEGAYSDGRRPDEVFYVKDIVQDLARRDFTINAIAVDALTGEVVDPWNGMGDIESGIIRAVGDPMERFQEDGLRVLRAARFGSVLNYALDTATLDAINPNLDTFQRVAMERVLAELVKAIQKSSNPAYAFYVMRNTGILEVIGGPLSTLNQEGFDEATRRLYLAPRSFPLAMAAMLSGTEASRNIIDAWLRRLTVSNSDRQMIIHLALKLREAPTVESIGRHRISPYQIRKWGSSVGRRYLNEAILLHVAIGSYQYREAAACILHKVLNANTPLELKDLELGGDALLRMGIPPTNKLGEILAMLLEHVLQDPSQNHVDRLTELVRTKAI